MAEPKTSTKAAKPKGGKQPPPEADKPPRKQPSGASKARAKAERELGLIEQGFSELLVMPAMPAMIAGDQWAADHFSTRGPQLAKRIAAECERNPTLRKWCLKALEGQSILMLGTELFMYAAPVAMHYGIVPGAEQLGVPVVKRKQKKRAEPEPEPEPAAAAPYVRLADGVIVRRDGAPMTPADWAVIGEEPPEVGVEFEGVTFEGSEPPPEDLAGEGAEEQPPPVAPA